MLMQGLLTDWRIKKREFAILVVKRNETRNKEEIFVFVCVSAAHAG
jgi:hypothetical protein